MKVAIFGAKGYIGRRLSRALEAAGIDVAGLSSGDWFDSSGLLSDALPVDVDIRSVVYVSQSPRYRELPKSVAHVWSVNVLSAVRAADWARRCGAKRFVYASSGSVYPPAFHAHVEDEAVRRDDWYALSKAHAEEALALFASDLEIICARLFSVYGPAQRGKLIPTLIESVREQRSIRLEPHATDPADRDGLRLSLTYVDDAVRVLAQLATTSGPRVLNVAGPDVRSIRAIADAVGVRLGRAPLFEVAPVPRAADLIADNARLEAIYGGILTGFDAGLDATLAAASNPLAVHDA